MRRFLRQVEREADQYHLRHRSAASLEELAFLIDQMGRDELDTHFHEGGNHFAAWVRKVIGDEQLAADLAPLRTKEDVVRALRHRLFMIEALTRKQAVSRPKRVSIPGGAGSISAYKQRLVDELLRHTDARTHELRGLLD